MTDPTPRTSTLSQGDPVRRTDGRPFPNGGMTAEYVDTVDGYAAFRGMSGCIAEGLIERVPDPSPSRTALDLVCEYRPTMSGEVLHAWAQDAVAALQTLAGADDARIALSDVLRRVDEGSLLPATELDGADTEALTSTLNAARAALRTEETAG